MNFPEHLKAGMIGGVLTTVAFSSATRDPEKLAAIFGLTVAGSLFPDLDVHSKPSKYAAMALTIAGCLALYYRELYPVIYFLIGFCFVKSFDHRTWVHCWIVPASLAVVSYLTRQPYFIPVVVGYSIHLLVDKLWPWRLSNWHKFTLPKMMR